MSYGLYIGMTACLPNCLFLGQSVSQPLLFSVFLMFVCLSVCSSKKIFLENSYTSINIIYSMLRALLQLIMRFRRKKGKRRCKMHTVLFSIVILFICILLTNIMMLPRFDKFKPSLAVFSHISNSSTHMIQPDPNKLISNTQDLITSNTTSTRHDPHRNLLYRFIIQSIHIVNLSISMLILLKIINHNNSVSYLKNLLVMISFQKILML